MSYFTQAYNWWYDLHPNRPKFEKEMKQKDLMLKQIKETKKFKLRKFNKITNKYEEEKEVKNDIKETFGKAITYMGEDAVIKHLIKNKNKLKILQNTNG